MRTLITLSLLILIVILGFGPSTPPKAAAQGGTSEPAHLVLSVDNGVDARLNRMDWDVNAWAPLLPGASVRASDYIDLSGRTTVIVLCADLTLIEQRGSEVPGCDPYATQTLFYYPDDPTWAGPTEPITVIVSSPDLTAFSGVIDNPGAFNLVALSADQAAALQTWIGTINELDAAPDAKAFALSSLYRGQGMLFDAIAVLDALPDLECSARRPSVDPPGPDERPLLKSPVIYLRLGELYQSIGQDEDATRYYNCGAQLAQTLGDPANAALASARLANMATDVAQATQLYQAAIDNYALLGAKDIASAVLEICGSRNCSLNQ